MGITMYVYKKNSRECWYEEVNKDLQREEDDEE